MYRKRAVRQLRELKKESKVLRLAADGWDEEWKTLIATMLSARTRDDVTIGIAERLFKRYNTLKKLSRGGVSSIGKIIRGVNYYKTKARHVVACSKRLVFEHNGRVPHDFDRLRELPGVGRKTANVFLAEHGHGRIGVDTHVGYISHYLGWTKGKRQEDVERDLEGLFPKRYWKDINWILVRFGQTHRSRKEKNKILDDIKGR